MQRMLKTNEVAVALGITPHAVRAMLRKGDIQGVKIGYCWYVPPAAIEKLFEVNADGNNAR